MSLTQLPGLARSTPLVLLPGLDGTGRLFLPLCSALGGDTAKTIVRYDAERSFEDYVETALSAMSCNTSASMATARIPFWVKR